jgi:glycosyltransferase involved in cell wall biosynthesis
MTVIYELSRLHEQSGGGTKLIVGKGTRHDYTVGDCIEVPFTSLPDRNHKIIDALTGRIGMPRRFLQDVYRPAAEALDPDYDGVTLVHNAPVALRLLKAAARKARTGVYCHNTLFGTYANRETRRTLAPADVIVCVSEFLVEDLTRRLGARDDRMRVVNNGVDVVRFQPAPATASDDGPVVLFLGRVCPEKGPDLLLQAAAKIADGKRKFKLRLVGSSGFDAKDPLSSYEQDLRQIAARIPQHVEFLKFVDRNNVVDQYHTASIFCAPSNCDDACPLTVPEAMACGLATIAARRGGIPEVGGDAALYFTPPNVDELAELLAHLIDDDNARAEWGRKARKQAETKSWENQYALLRSALF